LNEDCPKTLGSLFAGIGGFDIGFERAGWVTKWQVEWNAINRAVLADRFPAAKQFRDVRSPSKLDPVDCIAFGSPCTNISNMATATIGGKQGLDGPESRLFFEALRIIDQVQPTWVVFENVPALLHSNDCEDLQRVISEFAKRNYLGFARVLNAQFFGIPQNRRRFFLVAGLGRYPHADFLADAAPVESVPCSIVASENRPGDAWAGYTLTAADNGSRINLSSELFIAEENGWDSMAERARASEIHGFQWGLDEANAKEAFSAGNAICPAIAEWIARILNRS
jgi:DNA (cytosine-5)-methyltransferase 1